MAVEMHASCPCYCVAYGPATGCDGLAMSVTCLVFDIRADVADVMHCFSAPKDYSGTLKHTTAAASSNHGNRIVAAQHTHNMRGNGYLA